ncbi:unnamed protein product, partial [Durusdinium trenchii]
KKDTTESVVPKASRFHWPWMACRTSRSCAACAWRPRRCHSTGSLETPNEKLGVSHFVRHQDDSRWTEARQRPAAPGLPLRRKLRAWLSRRGRRHSESLVWATLHLWAQSAKAKRLLSARRKAAELKQSLRASEVMQVSTTLQIRCLLAWRALVQVNSQQDKQSFLAADLESKERCLRVLEVWTIGLEASLLRAFYRAWASSLEEPTAKALQLVSSQLQTAGLLLAWQVWVQQYEARRHRNMIMESALCNRSKAYFCALFGAWRDISIRKREDRANHLQRQKELRRQHRQLFAVVAMMLRTRGQMLTRLCLSTWHLLSANSQEGRVKLRTMMQAMLRKQTTSLFGAWKSHVGRMHLHRKAMAKKRRALLAAVFGLWKEQGAEALKEEFDQLWLKAALLCAARPLKTGLEAVPQRSCSS